MDDLSCGAYCSELLTLWDVEDESNFDFGLDSDEIDDLYPMKKILIGVGTVMKMMKVSALL